MWHSGGGDKAWVIYLLMCAHHQKPVGSKIGGDDGESLLPQERDKIGERDIATENDIERARRCF